MIYITKPFLPPREEFVKLTEGIWERNHLTNDGPLSRQLESELKNLLGVGHLHFLTNGTIALQFAIRALKLQGEIITTPFSFVATSSSIAWENCVPVFADIDASTCNINPEAIERAITKNTSAILATHVYGNPCDIDAIDRIAKKHNLKVIYDAAHCFGTTYHGKSVFDYGDISVTSFHATKLYHTVEGGATITRSAELANAIELMKNFGFNGPERFDSIGINGKNSEFHAAMGLCNLKYVNAILEKRKSDSLLYDSLLKNTSLRRPTIQSNSGFNYSYYSVIFPDEETMLNTKAHLESKQVSTRRYFYPLLSRLDYVKSNPVPTAEDISKRILCLPIYFELTRDEIELICKEIKTL